LDIEEETQEFPVMEVDSDIESKEIQQQIFMFNDLSEREDSEDEEPLSTIKKKLERQGRIFDCSDCERTFTDRKELFEHSKTHDQNRTKFDCDKCTKSFTKKVTLQIHLAADHASSDGLFDCPICFKCHKNKDCLRRHFYRHSNDSRFLCSLCGVMKSRKSDHQCAQGNSVSGLSYVQRMELAVEAVKEGMSQRKAAEKFGVKKSAVGDHMKKRWKSFVSGSKPLLTVDEEKQIVDWINGSLARGAPRRSLEVIAAANKILHNRSGSQDRLLGAGWLQRFNQRHNMV